MEYRVGDRQVTNVRVRSSIVLGFVLLAVTLCLLWASPAFATPEFQYETPIGAIADNTPQPVSVLVIDSLGVPIDATACDMTIDGTHQGVFSVDINSLTPDRALITADMSGGPDLTWGHAYTVDAVAGNTLGEIATDQWTFTPDAPPRVTSVAPASGAVVTSTLRPTVTVRVADLDDSSATLYPGLSVPTPPHYLELRRGSATGTLVGTATSASSYDPATHTSVYSVTPGSNLSVNTTYTVVFSAYDSASYATTTTAFFVTQSSGMTFTNAPVGTVTSATTAIDVTAIADDPRFPIDPANAHNAMSIDSFTVPATITQGADPTIVNIRSNQVLGDGSHSVIVTVRDVVGLDATDTWNFNVQSPPVASGFTPYPTATSTTPLLSVQIADNDPRPTSATMVVDGAQTVASKTAAAPFTLSGTPGTALSDAATHTVTVSMSDFAGNTSTATFDFRVQTGGAVTFSARTPAPGATIANPRPTVSVTATSSNDLVKAQTKAYFDGTPYTPVVSQPSSKRLDISVTDGTLSDGLHTAKVEVADVYSLTSSTSWDFTVAAPPSLTAPIPLNASTTGSSRPPVGLWVSDNSAGTVALSVTLDGASVQSGPVAQGAFWVVPAADLALGVHAVHASATDPSGNVSTLDWTFTISDMGAMADSRDCVNCHMGYAVPNHPAPQVAAACTSCHTDPSVWTPSNPDPWQHTDAVVQDSHTGSIGDCSRCHDADLVTEHAKYPSAGLKFQCVTCHDSKDGRVRAAIAAKNISCTACHDLDSGHTAVHDGGFASDANNPTEDCAVCHNQNIAEQHDNNCPLCHQSQKPDVIAAIANGNTQCGACHSTLHGATLDYFDFQPGNGVVTGAGFKKIFPDSWDTSVTVEIDNGSSPHSGYTQSTAKCEVCHAVHRAPTLNTSAFATIDKGGTATTSSRYEAAAWTAEASTQMLLRSTTARACIYCHVLEAPAEKMYAGDGTLAIVADSAFGWGPFYAHTTGCTSCHAVHGANTFKSADMSVDAFILKYQGVKNLGTIPLKVQPEVYGGGSALYSSWSDVKSGALTAAATSAGVTPLQGAITAQCTICHAQYAVGEEIVNSTYTNAELFQPASWSTANGSVAKIFVGSSANPVEALPGKSGITYSAGTTASPSGTMGSLIMAYKNHPMKAGNQPFKGSGASAFFASGSVPVSSIGSSVCQSCHNSPERVSDGSYLVQSFPHYTPGYYKFMTAQDQTAFDTPSTLADFADGRRAFYDNGGKPAVMNDGYCTRCHDKVGIDY